MNYETKGDKTIYSTVDDQVVCSPRGTIASALVPCSHEEADSRIFVHVKDMAQHGHMKLMILTVDTDVVVIAVAKFLQIHVEKLWVAFGTGKNYKHIKVQKIVRRIGTEKSQAMAFFHAFTGCDTVSFFSNRGKKSAWQAWQAYPEATDAFHALCSRPPDVPKTVLETLERFVVIMYDRTSEHQCGCSKALSLLQDV